MLDGNVLLRQKRDEVPKGTLSCPDRIMEVFYQLRHYEGSHLLPSICGRKLIQQTLITYDLYVDFSHLFVCNRIADLVLRNNKEITENGLVDLFDIIQWREAYQFENFGRFRRLQQVNKRLLAKSNIKV